MTVEAENLICRRALDAPLSMVQLTVDGFPVSMLVGRNAPDAYFIIDWLSENTLVPPSRLHRFITNKEQNGILVLKVPEGVIAVDRDITYNGK